MYSYEDLPIHEDFPIYEELPTEKKKIKKKSAFLAFLDEVDNIFNSAYIEVYSPDSYDVASDTFNGGHFYGMLAAWNYRTNINVKISTFFGLPNSCKPNEEDTLTWWKILVENMLGLEDNKSDGRNFINFATALTYTLWKNLAYAIFKTAQNTLKLATEFLPKVITTALSKFLRYAFREENDCGWTLKLLATALHIFIGLPVKIFHLIARAITSPIDSATAGWFWGKQGGSKLMGFLAAALSIAVSTAAYAVLVTVLFPLVLAASPILAAKVASIAAPQLASGFSYIGSHIMMPILLPLFAKLSLVMSPVITPAIAGLTAVIGAAVGFALPTIGTVVDKLRVAFREWWRTHNDYKGEECLPVLEEGESPSLQSVFLAKFFNCIAHNRIEPAMDEEKKDEIEAGLEYDFGRASRIGLLAHSKYSEEDHEDHKMLDQDPSGGLGYLYVRRRRDDYSRL